MRLGSSISDTTRQKMSLAAIGRHHSDEARQKMSLAHQGSKAYQWKGGVKLSKGYRYISKPDHHFANSQGYVAEHRLVVEEQWNCCLLPHTDVHHRDGNKLNNIWYNLWPMMRGQHTLLNEPEKRLVWHPIPTDMKCSICDDNKTNIKHGYPSWHILEGQYVCNRCNARGRYRLMSRLLQTEKKYAEINYISGTFRIPKQEWMEAEIIQYAIS